MKPVDVLFLLTTGLVLIVVAFFIVTLCRKRTILVHIVLPIILVSYIALVVSYPRIRAYTHAQRYDVLAHYLQTTYPNEQFTIEFRAYKDAIQLGDFDVSNMKTPNQGVTYRVTKDGNIVQLDGGWQKNP